MNHVQIKGLQWLFAGRGINERQLQIINSLDIIIILVQFPMMIMG
jgi:hypothetical protein